MDLELRKKCIIVTGGTRNLGRAVTLGFLREGANVVVAYRRDLKAARELQRAVPTNKRNNIRLYQFDVSSDSECRALCSRACSEFGRLDGLVNNAAVIRYQTMNAIKDKHFDEVLRHTLRGVLYVSRAAFSVMNGGGMIVNISSTGVSTGNPNELLYLCAKGGVEVATRAFARLGAHRNITVNAIAPHVIDSGMGLRTASQDPVILNRIPLRRMGRVDEFVELVLFLSSRICEYITGQIIHLNGGRWIG